MRFVYVFILLATPVFSKDPMLGWPVDCTLGETCYIQQYLDHDPGPGAQDYQCAPLSYDTHRGTDIAVPTLADMHRGVNVVAAAPGVVVASRDGVPDQILTDENAHQIKGRECGNRVAINHGDGWITDYCHLKQGSIAVQKGDRVAMGTVLGQIGLSGRTQFPHLHFSVQKGRSHVDPFDPDGVINCATPGDSTLWLETPDYRAGGVLKAGFAPEKPDFDAIKAGTAATEFTRKAPNLVFWLYAFGLRTGDQIRISLTGPKGIEVSNTYPQKRNQALLMRLIGLKRGARAAWPVGDYHGSITILRGGETIDQRDVVFSLSE